MIDTAPATTWDHCTLQGRRKRHLEISHKSFFTGYACVVAHHQLCGNTDILMFYERKLLFIVLWKEVNRFSQYALINQ